MKTFKALALGVGLAAAVAGSDDAMAAACATGAVWDSGAYAAPCDLRNGQVQFTLLGTTSLPVGATLSFANFSNNFRITANVGSVLFGAGQLAYSLSAAGLGGSLGGVRLSSNGTSGTTPLVTKEVTPTGSGTVVLSAAGGTSSPSVTGFTVLPPSNDGNYQIVDSYNFGAQSEFELNSFSNTFLVPEPATLGVLGIGLTGLALARRRRRKA